MGYESPEGHDPHDHGQKPVQMPSMHSAEAINADLSAGAAPTLQEQGLKRPALDFSHGSLANAFVMQEILRRPEERTGGFGL